MQTLLQEEHVSDWEAEKRKALAGQTGFMGRGAQTPGTGEIIKKKLYQINLECRMDHALRSHG